MERIRDIKEKAQMSMGLAGSINVGLGEKVHFEYNTIPTTLTLRSWINKDAPFILDKLKKEKISLAKSGFDYLMDKLKKDYPDTYVEYQNYQLKLKVKQKLKK